MVDYSEKIVPLGILGVDERIIILK